MSPDPKHALTLPIGNFIQFGVSAVPWISAYLPFSELLTWAPVTFRALTFRVRCLGNARRDRALGRRRHRALRGRGCRRGR